MRVLIATDAWHPQVNGVVRTYQRLETELRKLGAQTEFVHPGQFTTLPCPTYPEIRLALLTPTAIQERVQSFQPDYIHIATEGPIGFMARRYCLTAGRPYTTSFHTRFPEYVAARFPVKESWGYDYLRMFHNSGAGTMVSTPSLARELTDKGFTKVIRWTRGVDTELFKPRPDRLFGKDEPVFLYVGRVAIEKNITAFLDLELPGAKVVVGGGPQLESLSEAYPGVTFTGPKEGEALGRHFSSADVFVFPSKTDTFGIVLLEAMASGLPVAAYPVTGPKDIIEDGVTGILSEDLGDAARRALSLDKGACVEAASHYSWENSAKLFLENIRKACLAE